MPPPLVYALQCGPKSSHKLKTGGSFKKTELVQRITFQTDRCSLSSWTNTKFQSSDCSLDSQSQTCTTFWSQSRTLLSNSMCFVGCNGVHFALLYTMRQWRSLAAATACLSAACCVGIILRVSLCTCGDVVSKTVVTSA